MDSTRELQEVARDGKMQCARSSKIQGMARCNVQERDVI